MAFQSKDFLGTVVLMKEGGSPIFIPCPRAGGYNPANNTYGPVINYTGYPSIQYKGKRTPGCALVVPLKASWFNAGLVNDLIHTIDSFGDTADFHIAFWEPITAKLHVWSHQKCAGLVFAGAPMTEISCEMSFIGVYGMSEAPSNPFASFGSFTSGSWPNGTWQWSNPVVDAGDMLGPTDQDWNNTLSGVKSWRLSLMRGQAHDHFCDGSRFPAGVDTGMFGGTFVVEQSVLATNYIPENMSGTVQLRIKTQAPPGQRVSITVTANWDSEDRSREPTFGSVVRSYSLINKVTGGNPAVTVAY